MFKKSLFVTVFICFLLLAVGCGNRIPDSDDGNTITIEVANMTEGIVVSYALVYGDGLNEWGEEMLGDEAIEPGEIFSFVLPEGTYSLILMTYEYYVIPGARNINSDIRIEVGGNGFVPVLIKNNAEKDIVFLFLFESSIEDSDEESDEASEVELSFDDDILGDEVIPAGLGKIIFLRPGTYDFLGLDYEGELVLVGNEITIEGEATITVE